MGEVMAFDHIHLISRDPKAAAEWYREMVGGEIAAVQQNLRGAPQIDVRVGGMTIVIRGRRPGEQPVDTKPMQNFDGYSSHDGWGPIIFRFQLSRGSAGVLRGPETKRRAHGGGAVGIQTRVGTLLCRRARWREHRADSGEWLGRRRGRRNSCSLYKYVSTIPAPHLHVRILR
jgi:hypothetical protein